MPVEDKMQDKAMMTDDPRILIFEPEATGHHMEYIRYLLTGIDRGISNACVTLLTTEEAACHPNYQKLAGDFSHLLTTRIAPAVPKRSRFFAALGVFYERQWHQAEQLQRGLNEIGVDHVDFILVPHLESIGLLQIALRPRLFGGKPWATIAIGIRFHHRKCGIEGPFRLIDILQSLFFRWVIRDPTLSLLGSPNPYLARWAANPKVRYLADPCAPPMLSGPDEARAAYGIRPDTFVVLAFGYLDRRKCIGVLLEAAARARDEGLDLTVFLAGTQHPGDLAAPLGSEAARRLRAHDSLVEANRFIMGGKDIDPFSATDVTWVFYNPDVVVSSGVLVQSGLARRPVIARRRGMIGRLVEEHNLGLALTSQAPEIVAAALRRLAGDPALRREMGENGARAFAQNTPENFARPVVDGIKAALGRQHAGSYR